jgi:hypothetical protein
LDLPAIWLAVLIICLPILKFSKNWLESLPNSRYYIWGEWQDLCESGIDCLKSNNLLVWLESSFKWVLKTFTLNLFVALCNFPCYDINITTYKWLLFENRPPLCITCRY